MKVWVLRIERVFEGSKNFDDIEVYEFENLALKCLNEIVDDERKDWEEDDCFIGEHEAEFYSFGEYDENHFTVYIQEKEVIKK